MDSLAIVLRRVPIFAGVPAGSFARIIADLCVERHAAGTLICYEGGRPSATRNGNFMAAKPPVACAFSLAFVVQRLGYALAPFRSTIGALA